MTCYVYRAKRTLYKGDVFFQSSNLHVICMFIQEDENVTWVEFSFKEIRVYTVFLERGEVLG